MMNSRPRTGMGVKVPTGAPATGHKVAIMATHGEVASICEATVTEAMKEVSRWIFDGSDSLEHKESHRLVIDGKVTVPIVSVLFHHCYAKGNIAPEQLIEMLLQMKP